MWQQLDRLDAWLSAQASERLPAHASGVAPPAHPRAVAAFALVVGLVWLGIGVRGLKDFGPLGDWLRGDSAALAVLAGLLVLVVQSPVILGVLIAGRRMLRREDADRS